MIRGNKKVQTNINTYKQQQWATQRLKEYLVQGYAINEKRLAQKQLEVQTLKDAIRILSRAIEQKADDQSVDWLHYFAKGLELLDDYNHENLDKKGLTKRKGCRSLLSTLFTA